MPPHTVDPAYTRFLDLFNRGHFWDSHEALEPAWRDTRSDFYHALILFASAFVHVQRGNRHGIAAQLAKAEPLLHPCRPHYLGLDVDHILDHAAAARKIVADHSDAPLQAWITLVPAPSLPFHPTRVRGTEPELLLTRPP